MFFLSFNNLENLKRPYKLIENKRPLVMISEILFFIDNQCQKNVILTLSDGTKEVRFLLANSLNKLLNIPCGLKVGSVITINSMYRKKVFIKHLCIRVHTIMALDILGIQQSDENIRQALYDFENIKELPTHKVNQIEPTLTNKCWSIEVEVVKKTEAHNLYGPRSLYLNLKDYSGEILAKVVGDDNVKRFKLLKENHKYLIRNAEYPNKYAENIDLLFTKQTHFISCKKFYKKKDKLLFKFKNNPKLLKFYLGDNGFANNKSFCMLDQLNEKEVNTNVYVEAIIEEVGDLKMTKNGMIMRNISIVDMSGIVVNVVLWGEQAEKFSYRPGTMLLFIDALVNKFNNKYSLIVTKRSGMVEMEDFDGFKSCDQLREWWLNSWWPYRLYRQISTH